jgi:uncharacterized protein YraI
MMSAYPSNNAPQAEQFRCPFLGHYHDPSTYSSFDCPDNFCHKAAPERPVLEAYQAQTCLTAAHGMCPVYQHPSRWRKPLPAGIGAPEPAIHDKRIPLILAGMAAVLVFGIALMIGTLMLLGSRGPSDDGGGAQGHAFIFVQPTVPSTQESSFRVTFTPRPTRTPVPTYAPIVTELLFDNNLRTGPGTDYDSAGVLFSGSLITLRGRTAAGDWLLVESADGLLGWILATQIDRNVDISTVPGAGSTDSGEPSSSAAIATATPSGEVTTRTPEPLKDFEMVLFGTVKDDFCNRGTPLTEVVLFNIDDGNIFFNDYFGSYDSDSGTFEATAKQGRSTKKFDGKITITEDVLSLDGVLRFYWADGCVTVWDMSGETDDW